MNLRLLAGFLVLAAVFVVFNRGASRGYFDGDDLDSISRSRSLSATSFFDNLADLGSSGTDRPIGHLMYIALGRAAPLRFSLYVLWIHLAHAIAVALIFWLLRRLHFSPLSAFCGPAFFALDMAVFDIYWKPASVYDIHCAVLCLAAMIAWTYNRWLLTLLCFWLAYKSNQTALGLPFVLVAYEYISGSRRWKPLLPIVVFGGALIAQTLLWNSGETGPLWAAVNFYFGRWLWVPALAGLLYFRDRRAWLGLAAFLLFMTALPGRPLAVQLYVPSIGLAMLAACLLRRPAVAAAFFALWLPWNFVEMRRQRKPLVTRQHETRRYAEVLAESIRRNGARETYVVDNAPGDMQSRGVAGLLHIYAPQAKVMAVDAPAAFKELQSPSLALLRWLPANSTLEISTRSRGEQLAYLNIDSTTPVWQLIDGFYEREGTFRWMQPRATARLSLPVGATRFEARFLAGPQLMEAQKQIRVEVFAAGRKIGERVFDQHGWFTVDWPMDGAPAGEIEVEFRTSPPYQAAPDGSRPLGIAIGGFGFK